MVVQLIKKRTKKTSETEADEVVVEKDDSKDNKTPEIEIDWDAI